MSLVLSDSGPLASPFSDCLPTAWLYSSGYKGLENAGFDRFAILRQQTWQKSSTP